MNTYKSSQKGFAQLVILGVMALSIVSLSVATKFVQKNQDNRSKAAENTTNIPATGITMELESPMYLSVGDSLMMKYHLIPANSTDGVMWSITQESGVVTVDANGLVQAIKPGEATVLGVTSTDRQFTTQNIVVTDKDVGQVDIFYNLRESNDYRITTIGMDIVGELRLNTFGKSLSSAEITYYHTDALEPYLDGVTGTELAKIVSHKKYGGWNTLKVEFDKSKKPIDSVYVLKIKTKVIGNINNGRLYVEKGLVLYHSASAEETGTEIFNSDNKRMNIIHVGGTIFDIGNATNLSPTPTVISTTSKPRLYFEVSKTTYYLGETFEVTVSVDTASKKIEGVDVIGNYDASKLDLISVKQSESFVFNGIGKCVNFDSSLGKFIASCFTNESSNDRAVNGKLLTLIFKAKALGKAEFSFDCVSRSTLDSNIVSNTEDVIACEQNMQTHVVVMPKDNFITPTPIPVKGSKIDGKCGTTKDDCTSGGFLDIADSNINYMWKCNGINGGITKVCSLNKIVKTDGKCGIKQNTCISGRPVPLYGTSKLNRWKCVGINGGRTANCLVWK